VVGFWLVQGKHGVGVRRGGSAGGEMRWVVCGEKSYVEGSECQCRVHWIDLRVKQFRVSSSCMHRSNC
jgi:hypothetical protein